MKRRVQIAKALVHDPPILILDEPTAGVDIELRHMLWDYLRKINKDGKTILLTTHYIEEAEQLCETVSIIDDGNIIAGEVTTLRESDIATVPKLLEQTTNDVEAVVGDGGYYKKRMEESMKNNKTLLRNSVCRRSASCSK